MVEHSPKIFASEDEATNNYVNVVPLIVNQETPSQNSIQPTSHYQTKSFIFQVSILISATCWTKRVLTRLVLVNLMLMIMPI